MLLKKKLPWVLKEKKDAWGKKGSVTQTNRKWVRVVGKKIKWKENFYLLLWGKIPILLQIEH